MRWIVVAIIAFIVPYTYLTLRYRKPTSFDPYEDARERKHIASVGYTRYSVPVSRVTETSHLSIEASAPVAAVPGGLPLDLATELIRKPRLAASIEDVRAAQSADAQHDYLVRFHCSLPAPTDSWSLAGAHVYRKDHGLFVVVDFAPLADGLSQRVAVDRLEVPLPIASIDPGAYQVTLIGKRTSRAWTLQVH
jgi:hypothetical protein